MKLFSLHEFKENFLRVIDQVIATGESVHLFRKGRQLSISLESKKDKMSQIIKRDTIVGDPEELVHLRVYSSDFEWAYSARVGEKSFARIKR